MGTPLPQVNFRDIRQHETSQQRAFEELAYILVPTMERLSAGTRLERRSTPDAGIEFSCPAPDGSGVWAWQVKYLFRLDNSALQQMDRSVAEALATTPGLTRYALVLPIDRSGREPTRASRPSGRSGLTRWRERVDQWEREARDRGMSVEFVYLGHSDLLTALTRQEHAGALRWFFDVTLLTDESFKDQVAREINNLGDRYVPQVNVDLEIASVFDALACTPAFRRGVCEALADVHEQLRSVPDPPAGFADVGQAMCSMLAGVRKLLQMGSTADGLLVEPDSGVLGGLIDAAINCQHDVTQASDRIADGITQARNRSSQRAGGEPPEGQADDVEGTVGAFYKLEHLLWRLSHSLEALINLITPAVRRPVLILSGPAGCGKSHLVADVARHRVSAGLPTVLLLGQHFMPGQIWPQIADQVGVGLTRHDLLAALSVAAQVGQRGRALIVVDAVNEGAGAAVWKNQFAGLLADLDRYPHLALAVTVRDTYRASVLPATATDAPVAEVVHPGLAGHEDEALAVYTRHYGLRLPDVPPLHPELANPLFLRALCQSVQARGMNGIPREAVSLSWVFAGLIQAVNDRLADVTRLDFAAADNLAGRAVTALANRQLDTDSETLSVETARAICDELLPGRSHSRSLLYGLIAEGLLLQETVPLPVGSEPFGGAQQIRFTYQRLADHLRAEALLARHPTAQALASDVGQLLASPRAWTYLGMLEALALTVPEHLGVELLDLLDRASIEMRPAMRRTLSGHLLDVLAWRSVPSITPRTIELAISCTKRVPGGADRWLELLVSLACVPNHPLNVHRLDGRLREVGTAQRDADWSWSILGLWGDGTGPVDRLIEWAWSGRVGLADDEVVDLAGRLLAWLLTSPNRRLRDSATKALLRLTEHRTTALAVLVETFTDVDDPYVVERILAVAYGHVLRHRHTGAVPVFLDALTRLGDAVALAVFNRSLGDVPEHLLIRHYARACVCGVAEILAAHGRTWTADLTRVHPPYGSTWPLTAPSLRQLAAGYGFKPSPHLFAVTEIDSDFEKYVIQAACDDFVSPNQGRRQAARRGALYRKQNVLRHQLLAAIPAVDRDRLAAHIDQALTDTGAGDGKPEAWDTLRDALDDRATQIADQLERHSYAAWASQRDPIPPDAGQIARWVAQRTLDLGWSPTRFRAPDRRLGEARSRGSAETERFAKKYSWIAFYEVLGHLADHCQIQGVSDEHPQPYQGPWQITGTHDIDPSLVLRGDQPPKDTPAARLRQRRQTHEHHPKWWNQSYRRSLVTTGDHDAWLNDSSDIPDALDLLVVRDPHGDEWLALESHMAWGVTQPSGSYRAPARRLWMRSQSYLVTQADLPRLRAWAAKQNWMGLWMPTPFDLTSGLLGEYPDLPPWPTELAQAASEARGVSRDANPQSSGLGWATVDTHGMTCPMALATNSYLPRSERDLSTTDLPRGILPATALTYLLGATWAGAETTEDIAALGPVEREFSWLAAGRLVAFATGGRDRDGPAALFVRAEPLRQILEQRQFAIWTWVLGEKVYWSGDRPSRVRTRINAAYRLAPEPPESWNLSIQRPSPREDGRRTAK